MVHGVYSSSAPAERTPQRYAPLPMTEREAVALTHLIVQRRLDEVSKCNTKEEEWKEISTNSLPSSFFYFFFLLVQL
jgi:hypothetical protein